MQGRDWTEEEDEDLRRAWREGKTDREIAAMLGTENKVRIRRRRHRLGLERHNDGRPILDGETEADRRPPTRGALNRETVSAVRHAAENVSVDVTDLERRLREAETLIARLREQKKWETHCEADDVTGGKLTLRFSDHHHADENHLLSCAASLAEKFLVLVERYKPDAIQIVGGDDWLAGRGIFREQDLSLAVSDTDAQVQVGAVKWFRFLSAVRKLTEAPIRLAILEGNHEYATGKTKLGPYLFDKSRALCETVPGLEWCLYRHRALVNLAHEGHHHALAYHGYGHSKASPNSPAFIDGSKDDIIAIQQRLPPEQHIRRVLSGHTHWLSVDLERTRGIAYDTTGGLQRNDRVQLHKSSRPVGWIVYISPRGSSEIQSPIKLQPDDETHDRELSDPHLCSANRADCAECVSWYEQEMADRGQLTLSDPIGTTGGRW